MLLESIWHNFDIMLTSFPKIMCFNFNHTFYIELLTLNFMVTLFFMIYMACSRLSPPWVSNPREGLQGFQT